MSISRFSADSDVYLIGSADVGGKGICCSQCKLAGPDDAESFDADWVDMATHMFRHENEGHNIPGAVWDFLAAEMRADWARKGKR